jgi:hypothetical protein
MALVSELSSDTLSWENKCPYPECKRDNYFVQILGLYPCFDLLNDCQNRSAVRGVQKEALKFVINNCKGKIRIQGSSPTEGSVAGCF